MTVGCGVITDGNPSGGGGGGTVTTEFVEFRGQTTGTETITLGVLGTLNNPGDTIYLPSWLVYGRTVDAGRGRLTTVAFSQTTATNTTNTFFTNTGSFQFGPGTGWSITPLVSLVANDVTQTVVGQGTTIEWWAYGMVRIRRF